MQGSRLGRIGQLARTVGNIEISTAWYRDVMGLEHLFSAGTLAFFNCDGTRLMLSQTPEGSADESLIYFECDDIEATSKSLEARGVEFIRAPALVHRHEDGTEEWMAFFEDPDGRPLAIMSQSGGPAAP